MACKCYAVEILLIMWQILCEWLDDTKEGLQ